MRGECRFEPYLLHQVNGCVGKLVTPEDCKSSASQHCWFDSNRIHHNAQHRLMLWRAVPLGSRLHASQTATRVLLARLDIA